MDTVRHNHRPRTALGLFLGCGRLAYAEVRSGGAAPELVTQGCVPFALEPGRDDPAVFAAKLRDVLAEARVSVRHCRLALPLNWLVSSRLPAAGLPPESLADMAALELERLCGAPVPASGLVCLPPDASGHVLAVAVEPGVARHLAEACRRAGLRLQAFQPAVAGAPPVSETGTEVDILPLPEQMDALVRQNGRPVALRQLALYRDSAGPHLEDCLATAMRNLLVTLSGLDASGRGEAVVRVIGNGQLAEALATRIRDREEWDCPAFRAGEKIPAVQAAIMAAGLGGEALALAPPVRERPSRWWAGRFGRPLVAVGLVAVLAVLAFAGAFLFRRLEIRRIEAELARFADRRQEAGRLRDDLRLTAPWFRREPRRLAVLLAVAEAFPERGTVWVTDLAIAPDGTVSLTGSARDQDSLFRVTEALGKRTRNLGVLRTRQGARPGDPMTFSISFSLPAAVHAGGA